MTDLTRYGPSTSYRHRNGFFALSRVVGVDPATGSLASTAAEQFQFAFENVRRIAHQIGFELAEVGRLTVYLPDASYRSLINPPWLSLYPDEDRPARKTTHVPLPPGKFVELDVVGVSGQPRESLEIEGIRHKDPLPMAARLGPYVFSSVISPDLPGGGLAQRVDAIRQVYRNMAAVLESAGGTTDDVVNLWTYLGMWDLHPEMVDTWCETYSNEATRPSRKTFYYPSTTIQLQCDAVLGSTRRALEIPGVSHHDPIPMGASSGTVFTSSGVDGRDPATNKAPRGVPAQSVGVMANLDRLLAQGGFAADDLVHVTALLGEPGYEEDFLIAWRARFPDAMTAPALQVIPLGLPANDLLVQVLAWGVAAAEPPGTGEPGRSDD